MLSIFVSILIHHSICEYIDTSFYLWVYWYIIPFVSVLIHRSIFTVYKTEMAENTFIETVSQFYSGEEQNWMSMQHKWTKQIIWVLCSLLSENDGQMQNKFWHFFFFKGCDASQDEGYCLPPQRCLQQTYWWILGGAQTLWAGGLSQDVILQHLSLCGKLVGS